MKNVRYQIRILIKVQWLFFLMVLMLNIISISYANECCGNYSNDTILKLATSFMNDKKYDSAINECKKIMEQFSASDDTAKSYRFRSKLLLAGAYLEKKDFQKALATAIELKNKIGNKPAPIINGSPQGWQLRFNTQFFIGALYFRSKDMPTAYQSFQEAKSELERQKREIIENSIQLSKSIETEKQLAWINQQLVQIDLIISDCLRQRINTKRISP